MESCKIQESKRKARRSISYMSRDAMVSDFNQISSIDFIEL